MRLVPGTGPKLRHLASLHFGTTILLSRAEVNHDSLFNITILKKYLSTNQSCISLSVCLFDRNGFSVFFILPSRVTTKSEKVRCMNDAKTGIDAETGIELLFWGKT